MKQKIMEIIEKCHHYSIKSEAAAEAILKHIAHQVVEVPGDAVTKERIIDMILNIKARA